MTFHNKKIAIIGLGLMGGSLALALKKRFPRCILYGVSRSKQKIRYARRNRIIDKGSCDLRVLLEKVDMDIIIIATPVRIIKKVITDIHAVARNKPIVTDLGSTKEELLRWVDRSSFSNVLFVGSHPMAGSHEMGLSVIQKDLYTNTMCFVTKTSKTSRKALRVVLNMWKNIHVRTVVINPTRHDKIVSKISHLPHAIALLLVHTTTRSGAAVLRYAGSGFLDSTRIAQSDASIWIDILLSNKVNIIKDLALFKNATDTLMHVLKKGDERKLRAFLLQTSAKRKKIKSLL
ncbi:MAG: prephenate dehydrogenase [Candidatus Omnitrophota bacterium]